MIAGTPFEFEDPLMIPAACLAKRPGGTSVSEIEDMVAECESNRAACLSCDDGIVVVKLDAMNDDSLEMFVLLAVAFKHGAFERQEAALRSIARDLGAEAIAFRARRRGWARRLGPEWKRRGSDEFVRTI